MRHWIVVTASVGWPWPTGLQARAYFHLLREARSCLPSEVARERVAITARPIHRASTRRRPVVEQSSTEKILERMTLLARKRVMVTERTRKMLAQPFWGEEPMNWGSLRQSKRQMAKKGRRQPLKT